MKKFVNNAEDYVDEMLEGLYTAHPDMVTYINDDMRCLVKAGEKKQGKVALATGGGSGHLPLFLGYVGEGMLDGCAIGGVFQSPSAEQMYELTKEIDTGAGALYIYGNYSGDIINFEMAAEMAEMDDIRVLNLTGKDDVASKKKGEEDKRRGVAGIFFVFKCAGAAADAMLPLDEVMRVAQKAVDNVRTMGVAFTPCTIPEVGKPSFTLEDNEMEIGMGIHGEPGVRRGELIGSDLIVDEMLEPILNDLPYVCGDEVAVLINGLGATPLEEQYIIYRRVAEVLKEKGIKIVKNYIGEFATSMEMTGASISLLKLDEELKEYLLKPAQTPFFIQK